MITTKRLLGSLLLVTVLSIAACTKSDDINPQTTDADKFTGSWLCTEQQGNTTSSNPFIITITKVDANTVNIENIHFLSTSKTKIIAKAIVSGSALTISSQTIDSNTKIDGNGAIDSKTEKLNMNYNINDGQTTTAYSASCIRQ